MLLSAVAVVSVLLLLCRFPFSERNLNYTQAYGKAVEAFSFIALLAPAFAAKGSTAAADAASAVAPLVMQVSARAALESSTALAHPSSPLLWVPACRSACSQINMYSIYLVTLISVYDSVIKVKDMAAKAKKTKGKKDKVLPNQRVSAEKKDNEPKDNGSESTPVEDFKVPEDPVDDTKVTDV